MAASAPVVPLGHDATIRPVLLANWGLRRYQWRGFSRRSSAVEHPLRKRVVGGSNPSAGTDQKSCAAGTNRAKIPPYPSRFNPIAGPGKQPGKHPIKKKPRRQGRGSTLVRGCLSRPMPVKRRRDTDQQRAGGLFYVGAIILQQVCIVATRLFD